ncbi:MAG: 50S ribosomal protein L4 [Bacteroidota bacterium]
MKLNVYTLEGEESGKEVELDPSVFGIEPNETVVYEDVKRYLAHKRQGTANTKERGEVRGGGKKAYKQKGTGMARRGSIRSPLLKGGGTVFGPKPRSYNIKLTKKMKQLARKSVFSVKANEESIRIIEDESFDKPATKLVRQLLEKLELSGKKVLLLTGETDRMLYLSARNMPNVNVREAHSPSTYEILNADVLLIQESGLSRLENSFKPKTEEEAA